MTMTSVSGQLQADRVKLSNNLTVLHSRARANPSVVLRLVLRSGASRELPEQWGLAAVTGRSLRQGTPWLTKDMLAEELDGMGAGLSVDVGYSVTGVQIKCLSADFERSLAILTEIVRRPIFPESELERLRGQMLAELVEVEDSTRVAAEKLWRGMAYPADHRYHKLPIGTADSLGGLRRDDVVEFHRRWYGPDQATLIVVGDVALDVLVQTTNEAFGDWIPADNTPLALTLPETIAPGSAALQRVTLSGKTQADLVYGRPALGRRAPDFDALSLANHVLGRMYFMGRFGEKVRDEQGLAYYAYSELPGGFGTGPWTVRAGVNPRNIDRALVSIRAELERFLEDGPTLQEHADAISSLLGSLPQQLESNEGTASVLAEMDLYELGMDYLDRYSDIIQSLDNTQIVEAARRWLDPDRMITAIAGPADAEVPAG